MKRQMEDDENQQGENPTKIIRMDEEEEKKRNGHVQISEQFLTRSFDQHLAWMLKSGVDPMTMDQGKATIKFHFTNAPLLEHTHHVDIIRALVCLQIYPELMPMICTECIEVDNYTIPGLFWLSGCIQVSRESPRKQPVSQHVKYFRVNRDIAQQYTAFSNRIISEYCDGSVDLYNQVANSSDENVNIQPCLPSVSNGCVIYFSTPQELTYEMESDITANLTTRSLWNRRYIATNNPILIHIDIMQDMLPIALTHPELDKRIEYGLDDIFNRERGGVGYIFRRKVYQNIPTAESNTHIAIVVHVAIPDVRISNIFVR